MYREGPLYSTLWSKRRPNRPLDVCNLLLVTKKKVSLLIKKVSLLIKKVSVLIKKVSLLIKHKYR